MRIGGREPQLSARDNHAVGLGEQTLGDGIGADHLAVMVEDDRRDPHLLDDAAIDAMFGARCLQPFEQANRVAQVRHDVLQRLALGGREIAAAAVARHAQPRLEPAVEAQVDAQNLVAARGLEEVAPEIAHPRVALHEVGEGGHLAFGQSFERVVDEIAFDIVFGGLRIAPRRHQRPRPTRARHRQNQRRIARVEIEREAAEEILPRRFGQQAAEQIGQQARKRRVHPVRFHRHSLVSIHSIPQTGELCHAR